MNQTTKELLGAFCLAALSIYVVIYSERQEISTNIDYLHYYSRSTALTEKIIFLWTPKQGSYYRWSCFGADPNISGCDNHSINGKCLITTHPDLLGIADVVLFSIQDIKKLLLKLQSKGMACLVSDHNASQLLSVVDRAYVIANGTIVANGSPRQIVNNADAKKLYFGDDFL